MGDLSWVLGTITAKSDQLNAVDLVGGPITVEIQSVKETGDKQQPVAIAIGGGRQPFKPNLTMRRVLVACWGTESWVGRSMTLYNEPSVQWGGEAVGGVQISHLSHMDTPSKEIQLNKSKHQKYTYTIYRLEIDINKRLEKVFAAIAATKDQSELDAVIKKAGKVYAESSEDDKKRIDSACDAQAESFVQVEP